MSYNPGHVKFARTALFSQGFFILRPLRADGAHKGCIVAVFAGIACKNRNNTSKLTCEAGQNGGEMRIKKPCCSHLIS
ncbi:MAG: hypothetical protein JO215_04830 [Ktedonobacteraceae bacterium]|nr:hypothetical protein [Ktedonobacteraceae bacterium]